MMVAPELQFGQQLMGNLRPDRQHDGVARIEDRLIVGGNARIRIAGSEIHGDLFVARRQHD
jgi:hypothetical protein